VDYETLIVDVKDTIAVITVNRPKVLNALSGDTIYELGAAIDALMADDRMGAIVLTGAGDRSFVAGADIHEFNSLASAQAAAQYALRGQAMLDRIECGPRPVIAAINGFALGGGCELAMACDIRLAADTARLGQPEINLGILPGYGGTQRLPRLVGRSMAKLLCLTGDMISAEEALRIGLVDRVVPAAELMGEAEALAHKLASKAPVARALIKQAINVGLAGSLDEGLAYEAAQFGVVFDTRDRVEGVTAFVEKRPAQWSGT
jgi:enoyl-CoA hydratase